MEFRFRGVLLFVESPLSFSRIGISQRKYSKTLFENILPVHVVPHMGFKFIKRKACDTAPLLSIYFETVSEVHVLHLKMTHPSAHTAPKNDSP